MSCDAITLRYTDGSTVIDYGMVKTYEDENVRVYTITLVYDGVTCDDQLNVLPYYIKPYSECTCDGKVSGYHFVFTYIEDKIGNCDNYQIVQTVYENTISETSTYFSSSTDCMNCDTTQKLGCTHPLLRKYQILPICYSGSNTNVIKECRFCNRCNTVLEAPCDATGCLYPQDLPDSFVVHIDFSNPSTDVFFNWGGTSCTSPGNNTISLPVIDADFYNGAYILTQDSPGVYIGTFNLGTKVCNNCYPIFGDPNKSLDITLRLEIALWTLGGGSEGQYSCGAAVLNIDFTHPGIIDTANNYGGTPPLIRLCPTVSVEYRAHSLDIIEYSSFEVLTSPLRTGATGFPCRLLITS